MKIIKKFQESDGRRGFFLKYFTSFLIIFFVKFAAIKPTYAKLGRVQDQPNAIKPHYKKLKN